MRSLRSFRVLVGAVGSRIVQVLAVLEAMEVVLTVYPKSYISVLLEVEQVH